MLPSYSGRGAWATAFAWAGPIRSRDEQGQLTSLDIRKLSTMPKIAPRLQAEFGCGRAKAAGETGFLRSGCFAKKYIISHILFVQFRHAKIAAVFGELSCSPAGAAASARPERGRR